MARIYHLVITPSLTFSNNYDNMRAATHTTLSLSGLGLSNNASDVQQYDQRDKITYITSEGSKGKNYSVKFATYLSLLFTFF